ncbi:TonB-dependent receptor [Magnetospirillum fulvum]|uniref:TonB-dependent receptor n=1 Tax=Magnetospirillum fulvum MGU-K5 TaxID=1316936 RepID=S9S7F8_MAGFU|nr:TonB-dependent receptor [Magnetospirillum fulvum]EPY01837.1 TonB-dependent receptor [Magnetospirillum fulvum MGU-K5]
MQFNHGSTRARFSALTLSLTLSVQLPLPSLAWAEEAASTTIGEDSAAVALPAVTVTARRGEEKAKDVPFGLAVIDGDSIETGRMQTVDEALRNVTGVSVNSSGGPNDYNVRIRGVGSLYQMNMDDNSVVLNVDGVSMSSRNLSLGTLDVDQVEVLKGPQGTLFGRSSEAGAINITTRKPGRVMEGYVRGEIGQQMQNLEEGAIGGPVSDTLAARIAVRRTGADYWVNNAEDGKPLTQMTNLAVRGSLLWDRGTGTDALLTAEGERGTGGVNNMMLRPYGDHPALNITPGTFDENRKSNSRTSLEVNHDLSASRLTSVTAATTTNFIGWKAYDRDLTKAMFGFPMEMLVRDSAFEQAYSQELRLTSLPGAKVFWVSGLNVSHSNRSFDSAYVSQGARHAKRRFSSDSAGLFGEMTYPLTDALKITGGLRHSWDWKSYDADYVTAAGDHSTDQRGVYANYMTGRAGLSYAVTAATNLYGTVSRGYKSSGFNDYASQIADGVPYKAATVQSYEVGFKSEPARQPYTLNGALFLTRVKNDHMMSYNSTTFVTSVLNADTESKGAELEGTWRFDNGLALSGGVTYTLAQITSDASGVSGGDVAAGNRVPDVARWSGNLALSYIKDLPDFLGLPDPAINARISYRVSDSRPADVQNHFNLAPYGKLDLHLGLMVASAEIYAWADNLLNDRYDLYGYGDSSYPGVTYGNLARGRTLGLGTSYKF